MASASNAGLVSDVALTSADLLTETPGRFVLATTDPDALLARASNAGVPMTVLGRAAGTEVKLGASIVTTLDAVTTSRREALERRLRAAG
jgi:hypothetical protein